MQVIKSLDVDAIDRIRQQWQQELPELDTSPLETIGRLLRIEFLLASLIRRLLRTYDLDLGSLDVLATLRRSGAPYRMTPTQLYQELALTSGAMTHRMDTLERADLIVRAADPNDRRGMLAVLTPKGHALIEEAMRGHLNFEAEIAAYLSDEEQQQMAQLLKKLLVRMEGTNAHDK